MSFIRIAVAGLALCASASIAGAQGHEGHAAGKPADAAAKQGRGHSMLFKGITLTADQQSKLDALMAKHHTERQAMTPDGARPDAATREKRKAAMDKHYAEVREILTADQQKVFDANLAAMQERRQKRQSTAPRS